MQKGAHAKRIKRAPSKFQLSNQPKEEFVTFVEWKKRIDSPEWLNWSETLEQKIVRT